MVVPPSDFQVHISAQLDADSNVVYRFDQQLWRDSCLVSAPSLANLVRRACNNCEVVATCRQLLSKAPLTKDAEGGTMLTFKGGVRFTGNTEEEALALVK